MSEIKKLIERLCPDGVEYKKLGEIGTFTRGNGLQKKDFTDEGFPCIHYGQIHTYYRTFAATTISFTSLEYAKKLRKAKQGDVIIATTSEDVEGCCKAVAWLGDFEVAISGDAYIYSHNQNPKYISYLFQTEYFQKYKEKYASGVKVVRVSGDNLSKIEIPVPPIEVQRKIVEYLDNFTELEAELEAQLEAELEARKKQYEYYRNQLLTFDKVGGARFDVKWMKLGEMCSILDSMRKPITKNNRSAGIYPYYGASGIVDYVEDFIFDGDYLLVSEDGANLEMRTMPIAFSISGKNWVNNHAHILKFENITTQKYVQYYIEYMDITMYLSKGSMPKLTQGQLKSIKLPVPPLSEQKRIVSILDRFEALTTDLQSGLPAEIEARRKQYEYYREKLLTFKRKSA